jgi:GTPase SAR1 family protein
MFSWLKKRGNDIKEPEVYTSVADGLRKLYTQKLLPLETFYHFHEFHSPALDDPDFDSKPMVLLVGQYSTGKTTFIRYLLEQDFPGMRIGPEPTTDSFIVVSHGEEGFIPGHALVVDQKKPFRTLKSVGNAFLNRFQCSLVKSSVLESLSIIDTPGILSGEKQRVDRGYSFAEVIEWFAERVDRIILLFDANKLDISDEFRAVIESMKGQDDKIRIVLNKADLVDHQELMRVYGALMWALGKVLNTPEVARVYIGSFWDNPLHFDANRRLFELEEQDLFRDLQSLPRNAAVRKLNDLVKRSRMVKVHAYIMSHLHAQMRTSVFGRAGKKRQIIKHLADTFTTIQRKYQISPGDFPNIQRMQEQLRHFDFNKLQPLKNKLLDAVDCMLAEDIAPLMQIIPRDGACLKIPDLRGGAFNGCDNSPFGVGRGEGIDSGRGDPIWIVARNRAKYEEIFHSLNPVNGKLTGEAARAELVKSKLPNAVLARIWKLADIDQDGMLDIDEFGLALHLISVKNGGGDIPSLLPDHLMPPAKRLSVIHYSVN